VEKRTDPPACRNPLDGGLGGLPAEASARAAFLERVVSALHDTLIFGLDSSGVCKFVWADPELVQRAGIDLSLMIGMRLFDAFPPDVARERLRRLHHIFETGEPERGEYAIQLPGGEFWHDITFAPMRDAEGRIEAVVAVVRDITARKSAELRLRESEERYRRLIEMLPLGLVVHADGKVAYANSTVLRMLGQESAEGPIGSDVFEWVSQGTAATVRDRMRRIYAKEGDLGPEEVRLRHLDGTEREVEITSTMIDWGGRPASQVLVADVTERKQAEAERRALEQRAWRAQKLESLAVLAAGVAHDLNNLLATILGHANLVRMELPPDAAVRTDLDGIELAANEAAALARQLLAYSGRGSVARELVDLGQVIEQAAGLVAPAIARQVDLRYRLAGEVPRVEGDPTQLRQVAVNLITNAAEAIGSGGGSVTAVVDMKEVDESMLRSAYGAEALPPGRYACVEVTDTGPGIPEDVLPRIFDPFFTTKRAGRGLGLATVLGIVRAHGGTIQVETRLGQGTTFRVLLPVAGEPAGNTPPTTPNGST
jgi:two-component system cell cycle sensor histidine kinase/response regulator CckA